MTKLLSQARPVHSKPLVPGASTPWIDNFDWPGANSARSSHGLTTEVLGPTARLLFW